MFRRSIFTSARTFQAKVFPKLNNAKELSKFLQTRIGNVHSMIPESSSKVDTETVRKMLRLSGLNSQISSEQEQKWVTALTNQIGFINLLQVESSDDDHATIDHSEVFRLITSDHDPSEALGLDQLMDQVSENLEKDCEEKFDDFHKYINTSVKV